MFYCFYVCRSMQFHSILQLKNEDVSRWGAAIFSFALGSYRISALDNCCLQSQKVRMWLGGCCARIQCGLISDTVSDAVACALVPRLSFFFPRIHTDVARFMPNRLRFTSNRANLARIRPYRPYRIVSVDDRYGQNMPETAKIGLETRRNRRNFDLSGISCLLLSLFCESRHSNVFFKNILIVKIYRKYK